jgi:hypothetical protein
MGACACGAGWKPGLPRSADRTLRDVRARSAQEAGTLAVSVEKFFAGVNEAEIPIGQP